ncbi:hypothetical protein Ae201684P_007226 [Aphanomyces euteiches]|uniref:Disease resistance R13L4/SHOC-2-like LRR domain-containing protein n=1 Tax=Aphanomyces euteiches TaxID=100861 RepID=A0A6G0X8U4_9STRA|nr:hypothetical protein Ae201684_007373 [Aphanomyces euteiches]KAH9101038.1 hypothetical protein Ae201684P_007226 [Aphanomyces euteiches]
MQRTLRQSRHTGSLNLSARELKDVPDAVYFPRRHKEVDEKPSDWKDLVKLDLSYNDIVTLSPDIEQLKALTWLKLKQNQILDLPSQLGALRKLVFLDVSNNQLLRAPQCLSQLQELRELSLSGNSIKSLPDDIGLLVKLESLTVDQNQLCEIPASVGSLALLRTFTAQENSLEALPESFQSLELLETIDVSKNKLSTMPSLEAMSRLKSVDLRHNQLTDLPSLPSTTPSTLAQVFAGHNRLSAIASDQIARVGASLTLLDLRFNQLELLPSSVSTLVRLKTLDVSNNNLIDLPSGVGSLESLNHLAVDGNPLQSIRQSVLAGGTAALKQYLISKNPQVTDEPNPTEAKTSSSSDTLPDHLVRDACASGVLDISNRRSLDFSSWTIPRFNTTLVHLNVSKNGLTALPSGLGAFTSLQTLKAEDNHLTELPADLASLPRLQALRLQRNHLTNSGIASELDLRHNELTEVPQGLDSFASLDTLLLSYNKLNSLGNHVEWRHMTKLTTVHLSHNQLESLGSIYLAPCLTALNAENNNLQEIPLEFGHSPHLCLLNIAGNPQRGIRYSFVQKGSRAVLQYLREQVSPPLAAVKRPILGDHTDSNRSVRRKPAMETQEAHEQPPPAESDDALLTLAQLNEKIKAAEGQLDGYSLSTAKQALLKKDLARWRAARARLDG